MLKLQLNYRRDSDKLTVEEERFGKDGDRCFRRKRCEVTKDEGGYLGKLMELNMFVKIAESSFEAVVPSCII